MLGGGSVDYIPSKHLQVGINRSFTLLHLELKPSYLQSSLTDLIDVKYDGSISIWSIQLALGVELMNKKTIVIIGYIHLSGNYEKHSSVKIKDLRYSNQSLEYSLPNSRNRHISAGLNLKLNYKMDKKTYLTIALSGNAFPSFGKSAVYSSGLSAGVGRILWIK